MAKQASPDPGAAREPGHSPAHPSAQPLQILDRGVGQGGGVQVGPELFHRIQLGGIGGQRLNGEPVAVAGQGLAGTPAAVGGQPIPEQDYPASRWQKQRWFRAGQRWRTRSEGRISVLKRRHGLDRCRYRGFEGIQRWVGLGVIANNLIRIGRHLALQHA